MMRAAIMAFLLALAAVPSHAALVPRDVAGVAFAPQPGVALPVAARFTDEHGRAVALGDYFRDRPALVVLGYYGCSDLCGLAWRGLADGLARAGIVAGRDTDVVIVSIAPLETPASARARKAAILGASDHPDGWHFLTGNEASIAAVTHALGFRAAFDADAGRFAHATGVAVVDPGGTLRTLLPGIVFPPATLRAALAGTPSPPSQPVQWLLCLHADLVGGRYTPAAMTAVRITGVAGLCVLGVVVVRARRRGSRREAR